MAATGMKKYELWNEVDPMENRIHIIGQGDYVRNIELEAYFSQLFEEQVKAVYTHALMSNAKRRADNGIELFQETIYIFKRSGKIVRIRTQLELAITTSTDVDF